MEMPPDEALRALAGARDTLGRSRRLAVEQPARFLLVYWGVAWMLLYTIAAAAAPGWLMLALMAALILAPIVWCRLRAQRGARGVRTGWEPRLWAAWWALVLGSAAIAAIAGPLPAGTQGILTGALWGLAFVLYGAAMTDIELGALGAGIVVLALVMRLALVPQRPALAVALFGVLAGGAMAALGLLRLLRARHFSRQIGGG